MRNEKLQHSQCTMYKLNYSELLKSQLNKEDLLAKEPPAEIIPCQNGWVHDRSVYRETVVTEVLEIPSINFLEAIER